MRVEPPAAQRAQMQTRLRWSAGTAASASGSKRTWVHQHGESGAALDAIAHAFALPHSGHWVAATVAAAAAEVPSGFLMVVKRPPGMKGACAEDGRSKASRGTALRGQTDGQTNRVSA